MSLNFVPDYNIRQMFTDAMSQMYSREVPAYSKLVKIVEQSNAEVLQTNTSLKRHLETQDEIEGLSVERHGAIRVGKAEELSAVRRAFAVMGMMPVGYYDLSVAGLPIHSTAFRPVDERGLKIAPFRVFTSLLRLEKIEDVRLRDEIESILSHREIVSKGAIELIEKFEAIGGLEEGDALTFVEEITKTFKWHETAQVSKSTYESLKAVHPLVADIVCFKGPHINHLTPRVLDIDVIPDLLEAESLEPKEIIEGPPKRECPILLRQTAFRALKESIFFPNENNGEEGSHSARFGEIEQRGAALTPKGRALYDDILEQARVEAIANGVLLNSTAYSEILEDKFKAFPDDWETLRNDQLVYFKYTLTEEGKAVANCGGIKEPLEELISEKLIEVSPILYEDFLPVSAAGIFRSNLSDKDSAVYAADSNQTQFEQDLGADVIDPFDLYNEIEQDSLSKCLEILNAIGVIDG